MAKKKKRKEVKKTDTGMKMELIGFLFILLSVIGFGEFGIVGNVMNDFCIFLAGNWYSLLLVGFLAIGCYMMVKREVPCFFTSKLVGIYILVIGILVFSHISYIEEHKLKGWEIISKTVHNFMEALPNKNLQDVGGGLLGALFSGAFVSLFDIQGTYIVVWSFIALGIVIFTGVSIVDVISSVKENAKKAAHKKEHKTHDVEIKTIEDEYEKETTVPKEEPKLVISSMEELKTHVEEKEENPMDGVVVTTTDEPMENKNYTYPPIRLLKPASKSSTKENEAAVKDTVPILGEVFKDFGIEGKVVKANIGPSVTQYEMEIKAGTKVSKILSINREIALALAAKDVRIQAPIPGKSTIGIEIPNKKNTMVCVREILESVPKNLDDSKLLAVLGRDIMGKPQWMEINKTPHLLVAGSTGSGKSVCINSLIVSMLMRSKPDEVKLVLVDPKKVELSMYNGVPHLLTPVVTSPQKANIVLKKMVSEMENRYDKFEESGTKNIAGYNAYTEKQNALLPDDQKMKKLPYIVIIIDELADLMLVAAKEVEDSIMRITQMARAAGIHLIVATQRPSTDVITGVVKANIPSRISFAVSSSIDSRTILDMVGAEKLLGKGDMLFLPQGENTPIRIQGTFISDEEIKAVVDYTISQQKARYDETILMSEEEKGGTTMTDNKDDYEEPLYNEIVEFVVTQGKASASLLQRRFRLGYNRAARCIDLLEERGIIGPSNGSKPREVLVKLENKDEN